MVQIATLSLGNAFVITSPTTIIPLVLRNFFSVPKSAVNTFQDMVISLPDIISRYGYDKNQITTPIFNALNTVFNRIFPTAAVNVDVTTVDQENGAYDISISVIVTINGMAYTVDDSTSIVDGQLILQNDTVPTVGVTEL